MEKKKLICPYCASENVSWVGDAFEEGNKQPYICHECDEFFGEEDITRETLRHEISSFLMDTDEDKQEECHIPIDLEETQGLSESDKPYIDRCYQMPCEGIIVFHIYGTPKDEYCGFDDLSIDNIRKILDWFNEGPLHH